MIWYFQDTVSVHRPSFYAQRFQEFMAKKVFKKIPSRKYEFIFNILVYYHYMLHIPSLCLVIINLFYDKNQCKLLGFLIVTFHLWH